MRLFYTSVLLTIAMCLCGCSKSTATGDTSTEIENDSTTQISDESSKIEESKTNVVQYTEWPPSKSLIMTDLIGHTLSEGTDDGYFDNNWVYKIEYGEVEDFEIVEILSNTENKYLFVANIKLKGGDNFYYDAKARINYVRNNNGEPVLDYVKSLGLIVVATDEYMNDIKGQIYPSLVATTFSLKNDGEVSLLVGGEYSGFNGWTKFSQEIPPHSEITIDHHSKDFHIDFVARKR